MSGSRVILGFDVGVKNLAYCAIEVRDKVEESADVILWEVISLAEPKEKIPSIAELSGRLFMALDELSEKLEKFGHNNIDTVLIENQPSRLNGSMKSIQMMIYSYFQLRKHWEGKARSVQMVSAAQKIAAHLYPDMELPEIPTGKVGYALNKWKAIQYGNMYIKNDPTLVEYIKQYKKKDDAFDAMLHVVAWLRKSGYCIKGLSSPACFGSMAH